MAPQYLYRFLEWFERNWEIAGLVSGVTEKGRRCLGFARRVGLLSKNVKELRLLPRKRHWQSPCWSGISGEMEPVHGTLSSAGSEVLSSAHVWLHLLHAAGWETRSVGMCVLPHNKSF